MISPVMEMQNTFGNILRGLREDRDLSQTDFGKAVGMTQRKVSYLETGKCEPSLDDLRSAAVFFNLSVDYLLGLCDTPKPLYEKKKKLKGQ